MGTCCAKLSPVASRWTSTDKVGGCTGGFAIVDPAFPVRRASGAQPRARSTANHAIARQIALMAGILLRNPMFHHSFVCGLWCRLSRLIGFAWCRVRVASCRCRDLRGWRSVCVSFDLSQEADAHFGFRVPAWHQLCESRETLLCPVVEDAGAQHFYILFVYVDGFLLERKRLLIEGLIEVFQLLRAQIGGPLRLQE